MHVTLPELWLASGVPFLNKWT